MNRRLSLRLFYFALLSVFVLSACDSGGSNGGETVNNEFSFDISPTAASQSVVAKADPDTTLSGFSFFYSGTDSEGDEAFAIYFSGGNNFSPQTVQQGLFGYLFRNELRSSTGTGTFPLVNPDQGVESGNFIGILFEDYTTTSPLGTNAYYVPKSGSQGGIVDITNSSGDEVSGSVDLTAYRLQIDTTGTNPEVDTTVVDITGSFTAKDIDQYAPLIQP